MNIFQRIVGNTAAQIVSRVLSSCTGFILTILVARYFGISGYADIAKITAFVTLFYLGIDLGANAVFLQLETKDQRLSDLLAFRLFSAGVLFLLVVVLAGMLPYNVHETSGYSPFVKMGIVLFAFSYFSRAVVFSTGAFFQQSFLYSRTIFATLASAVVTIGVTIFAILNHFPIVWILGAYVAGGFAEAIVSIYFVRTLLVFAKPSFSFFKNLFWQTLPLTFLLFLNLLYFRVDMILLSFFQKAIAVGLYDFAYKFFDFLIALPLFLSNSLYPIILAAEKNSRIQRKNISLYTVLFFGLGLLLIPGVWFLSPLLVLVKQDFALSIPALRLLSFSLPIFFATSVLQWIFIAKKKQKFLVVVYAVSLAVNIMLNLIFIPQYSYFASAVITGFSEGLIFIAMICYALFLPL